MVGCGFADVLDNQTIFDLWVRPLLAGLLWVFAWGNSVIFS